MKKKEIVAMVLAGGQGSRLGLLTKNVAKPAVAFGGKYMIVDFVLSNCTNSGIDTVGILTQYKPWELTTHIGVGKPWDLDKGNGGVTILPPFMKEAGGNWYKGTANAIYQNLMFLETYNPEYVLVLSGDHIYKMDYSEMLEYHIQKGADATIAVINVTKEEASRFGIMNVNEEFRVCEFEEKPKKPRSTLASMGVYIFNYHLLKSFLMADEKDEKSANDFGKNIIPNMLLNFKKLYAYPFKGYWKDIGTIESIWEANMDLINPENELNLFADNWKIYTKTTANPAQYIGENASVEDSIISEGCVILGKVNHSVIFPGVYIGENAEITDSIVMQNTKILGDAVVINSIISAEVVVHSGNTVGNPAEITVIEQGKNIRQKPLIKDAVDY